VTIAYDLRYASDHFAGIGTHTYALLEALLELPGDERYAVLWNPALENQRFDLARIARHPRVSWHEHRIPPTHPVGLLQVGRWLRNIRPSVYLSTFYLRPLGAGCPSVLMLHDVWPLRYREGLSAVNHVLYRASLALAAGARFIITSSEFSRAEVVALTGMRSDRVRAALQGVVPAATVAPVRPDRLPDGVRQFALVVGDNRPRKNLALLARIWRRLDLDLPLVSAGPSDPRFPTLTGFAGSDRRDVHSLGWVSPGELEWLYRNARLLLFPSRYEGFGFPLVEAFAHDLPVVASTAPALREVAGGAAVHAPPDDDDAWVDAVRRLATDEPERSRRIAAGRMRLGELDYRHTAEVTLAVLREAAQGAGLPPATSSAKNGGRGDSGAPIPRE
jgi:glycosyltransferase involved in cell wall biosynthesis